MDSKFFDIKTSESKFEENLNSLSKELSGKKVMAIGSYKNLKKLNKMFQLSDKFNITSLITDKKEICLIRPNIKIMDIKSAKDFKDIENEQFDCILIIGENVKRLTNYLLYDLSIPEEKIRALFEEKYKDESENLDFLYHFNFNKTLPRLIKKLKNKKVVLYGAGLFLQVIKEYFDISDLNVVAIADMRFENHEPDEKFLEYDVCAPDEIEDLNPDYVIVATKYYINIMENLYYEILKNSKIKIKPLVKKDFFTLLREI